MNKAKIAAYRGDILYFTDNPAKVKNAYEYYENGILYIQDGKVLDVGSYSEIGNKYLAEIVDYSGRLIIPGFVDTHIHYPQIEMIASYGAQLLEWLNTYTFPTEQQFANYEYADKLAQVFLQELINHGTTSALVFATVHPNSVEALFTQAYAKNMRIISGKVLMDRNAPDYLLDTAESAYLDSKALIDKWHDKGRLKYAVTPRFAPTSSDAELAIAGKLLQEYPDIYMHTHLAENHQEIAWVRDLFPWSRSYLDVYDKFGLVTDKSVFAHSIHIDHEDCCTLANKSASIAFCPTSNLFLGSGLFDLDKANEYNIKVGLGTDVGAGTSFSLIQTMSEAYKVTQLRKAFTDNLDAVNPLDPLQNLYLATLGGARALSLDNYIGSFKIGNEADFLVINPNAISALGFRYQHTANLLEKLFAIQTLGDDRVIEHTYIMGKKLK